MPLGIKDILELRPGSNCIQIEQRDVERDSEKSNLTAWVGARSYHKGKKKAMESIVLLCGYQTLSFPRPQGKLFHPESVHRYQGRIKQSLIPTSNMVAVKGSTGSYLCRDTSVQSPSHTLLLLHLLTQ